MRYLLAAFLMIPASVLAQEVPNVTGQAVQEGKTEYLYIKRKSIRPENLQTQTQPKQKETFVPVAEPEPEPPKAKNWTATAGMRLIDVLRRWVKEENVKLMWKASNTNLYVTKTMEFDKTFENAVATLLDEFKTLDTPPRSIVAMNPSTGQKTLTITDKSGKQPY